MTEEAKMWFSRLQGLDNLCITKNFHVSQSTNFAGTKFICWCETETSALAIRDLILSGASYRDVRYEHTDARYTVVLFIEA